jgi:hypothetical protein
MRVPVLSGSASVAFIARPSGDDPDFVLPDGGEPQGGDEFMAGTDVLVIDR